MRRRCRSAGAADPARLPLRWGVIQAHAFLLPPRLVRILATTLLVAATASWAQVAAPPSSPTDDAFDALLSLPQGLPEGSEFPASHPDSIIDEATLRAALEDDLAAGADLNASRHGGTLLHHALRADLQDTALWLLAHGADPRREVQDDASSEPGGRDALQLAIVFRRWRVVDALLRRPAVAPHTPRDLAFRWTGALDRRAEVGTVDDAARELARRLAWPTDWHGGCLLAAAQDRVVIPMLLKSTDRLPVRRTDDQNKALKGRDREIAAQCGVPTPPHTFGRVSDRRRQPAGRFWKFAPVDLVRADARVAQPLLQLLAPLLDTPADVHTWATLPMRRPWLDIAFTRAVFLAFLGAPTPDTRDAALRTIPPDALRAALDDDATLHAWLTTLATLPRAQATAALAEIDGPTLERHVEAAVTGLGVVPMGAGYSPDSGRVKAPAAVWSALLARLPAPLPLRPGVEAATFVPEVAWPALFAHGYRPSAAEIVMMWTYAPREDWRRQWPRLRAAASPETVTAALADIVSAWTKPCDSDGAAPWPEQVEKLGVMVAPGVRLPPALPLSFTCARRAVPEALHAVLATGLVTAPPGAAGEALVAAEVPAAIVLHGKFVLAPRACSAQPHEAIVRAAIRDAFLVDGPGSPQEQDRPPRPTSFQAIDDPGATGCAWLVTGGVGSYRAYYDEDGFYDGHYRVNPCVEPTRQGEVWRVVDGRVVASRAEYGGEAGALLLKESEGPRGFVLTLPVRGGGCDGGQRPQLFTWTGDAENRHLSALVDADAARQAFDQQCRDNDPTTCFGMNPDADLSRWQPQSVADFVAENGDEQRQRWIAAFLANDATALKALDVFPAWRAEGFAALTASTLPLDERRRRIAWMFRDKAGMAASFGSDGQYDWAEGVQPAIVGLVAWLPREDWRPLLAALGKDSMALAPLLDAAKARGDGRLACMFAQASGQACDAAASTQAGGGTQT